MANSFATLLSNPQLPKAFLIRLKGWDNGSSSEKTIGFISTDLPENAADYDSQIWNPKIVSIQSVQTSGVSSDLSPAPLSGLQPSRASFSIADTASVTDSTGTLIDLRDLEYDGRQITILMGDPEGVIGDFGTVLEGTIEGVQWTDTIFSVSIASKANKLDAPIQENTFLGDGSVGEGNADLKKQLKPLLYGIKRNFQPILLDEARQIYSIHESSVEEVIGVFDRGIELTNAGDITTLSLPSVDNWTPIGGSFITDLANGLIRLGAIPDGPVTVDAKGDNSGGYIAKLGEIVERILTIKGPFVSGDIDSTTLTSFNSDRPGDSGIYLPSGGNILQLINRWIDAVNAIWYIDRTGLFQVKAFGFTSSVATINDSDLIESPTRRETNPPVFQARIGYKSLGLTQDLSSLDLFSTSASDPFNLLDPNANSTLVGEVIYLDKKSLSELNGEFTEPLSFGVWFFDPTGDVVNIRAEILFFNDSDIQVGSLSQGNFVVGAASNTRSVVENVTIPSGATKVTVRTQADSNAEDVENSFAMLNRGPVALPFTKAITTSQTEGTDIKNPHFSGGSSGWSIPSSSGWKVVVEDTKGWDNTSEYALHDGSSFDVEEIEGRDPGGDVIKNISKVPVISGSVLNVQVMGYKESGTNGQLRVGVIFFNAENLESGFEISPALSVDAEKWKSVKLTAGVGENIVAFQPFIQVRQKTTGQYRADFLSYSFETQPNRTDVKEGVDGVAEGGAESNRINFAFKGGVDETGATASDQIAIVRILQDKTLSHEPTGILIPYDNGTLTPRSGEAGETALTTGVGDGAYKILYDTTQSSSFTHSSGVDRDFAIGKLIENDFKYWSSGANDFLALPDQDTTSVLGSALKVSGVWVRTAADANVSQIPDFVGEPQPTRNTGDLADLDTITETEIEDDSISAPKIQANAVIAQKLEIGSRTITTRGIEFSANSPAADRISWTSGILEYTDDSGTAASVSISAGNTTSPSTADQWIYWIKGETIFRSTTTQSTAFGLDRKAIARYKGGIEITVFVGRTIIEGDYIKTGTVDANRIKASTALLGSVTVDGTALSDTTTRADDPAARINLGSTLIAPGLIEISGATTLDSWRQSGDLTKIAGGSISTNTIDADKLTIGSRNVSLDGIKFQANDPATDQASWTSGSISYIDNTGTAVSQNISSGNTGTVSVRTWIYWSVSNGTLSTTTTRSTAFGSNNLVLASYAGGIDIQIYSGQTVIDGGNITADTITATQLIKTSALITAGVQISDGLIQAQKLVLGSRAVTLEGIEFNPNDPATNRVSWTAGSISYVDDTGTLQSQAIIAGNTASATTTKRWIYWTEGTNFLVGTTTQSVAFADNRIIVATYQGGLDLTPIIGQTQIDGSKIRTGTLIADDILTGTLTADVINLGSGVTLESQSGVLVVRGAEGTSGELTINPSGTINPNSGFDVSGGGVQVIPRGAQEGMARDADSITYNTSFVNAPIVRFEGGITTSSTATNPVEQIKEALNASISGFTANLRLSELAGSPVVQTDGPGAAGVTQDFELDKSAANAVDDIYTFQFDVNVTNITGTEPSPGVVTVGIYTNDGAGWIQRTTKNIVGNPNDGTTSVRLNNTASVAVSGLTNHAGKEFGITVEFSLHGGAITSFDSVKYTTGTTPSDETLTPSGSSDVKWLALEGIQS